MKRYEHDRESELEAVLRMAQKALIAAEKSGFVDGFGEVCPICGGTGDVANNPHSEFCSIGEAIARIRKVLTT